MKTFIVYLLALVLPVSCLTPPKPWVPPGDWIEVAGVDVPFEVEAKEDGRTDVTADLTDEGADKTDLMDDGQDAIDAFDEQGVDGEDVSVDECADQHPDENADYADGGTDNVDVLDVPDEGVSEIDIVDQAETPDVPDCPPGYSWDPETQKCVSFCPADQYFEAKLMKCVFYPCCDLTGAWKASLLNTDTMVFTIYDLQMDQTVSYLQAVLMLDSPPEVAECSGLLENKELALYCTAEGYSLLLNSTTVDTVNAVDTTGKFSGFYSFSYKKGGVKTGPVNFEKK